MRSARSSTQTSIEKSKGVFIPVTDPFRTKYEVPPAKLPECGASSLMRTISDSPRA